MKQSSEFIWFISILGATLLYGIQNFLYKISAVRKLSNTKILNTSALTVSILSLAAVLFTKSKFDNLKWLIVYSLLNSTFFAVGTLAKMSALKRLPASYVFPVTRMHSIVAILLSVIFLSDRPALHQWIGISIALLMGHLINQDAKREALNLQTDFKVGVIFSLLTVFATGLSVFVGKLASLEVSKINYMFVSYSAVFFYTLAIDQYTKKSECTDKYSHLGLGVLIGILNFLGYYLILSAFEQGPLSISQGIMSTSFLIPIILAVIFLKEKITFRRFGILGLGLIAIILMSI